MVWNTYLYVTFVYFIHVFPCLVLFSIESSISQVEQLLLEANLDFEVIRTKLERTHQLVHVRTEVDDLPTIPLAIRQNIADRKDLCRRWKEIRMCTVHMEGWLVKRGTFFWRSE